MKWNGTVAVSAAHPIISSMSKDEDTSKPASSKPVRQFGHSAYKPCANCGEIIRDKPSAIAKRRYCSKACKSAAEYRISREQNSRSCMVCGKMVYRPPAHLARTPDGVFCSHECHGAYNRGEINPAYRGGLVKCTCKLCGKAFERKPGLVFRALFCSRRCAILANWQDGRIGKQRTRPKPCAQCGKVFQPWRNGAKCCSRKCAAEAHSLSLVGQGNGRYVHGQAQRPYPPGWTNTYKAAVRARDNHRCLLCGHLPKDGERRLDVHHVDYMKKNLDPANLGTFCRFCHGGFHGGTAQRFMWNAILSSLLKEPEKSPELPTIYELVKHPTILPMVY